MLPEKFSTVGQAVEAWTLQEFLALRHELMEEGVSVEEATMQARVELGDVLAYAAEWDRYVLDRFRRVE